jgi:histidinol-phosphate aminotransferase
VRLNTNENPYPPPVELVEDLRRSVGDAAASLNRYPDREAADLRAALAAYLGHGVRTEQVWAANGSNEVLQQLLMAFGGAGRSALGFVPSYSMHHLIARATGTAWQSVHRPDDFSLDAAQAAADVAATQPDLVFLCSPNNPTGTALDPAVVEAVLAVAPGMVVVDEAYAEFSHQPTLVPMVVEHPRLVVTRTMSKAFALAGGRLGYLAASRAVVDAVRIVRLPYHLSAISQVVARVALANVDELLNAVADLRAERDRTVEWLRSVGLQAADSDANFVLFGTFPDRRAVWQGLLDRGVLIRETGPDGWLRVSIGTPEEMAAFRHALQEVLA